MMKYVSVFALALFLAVAGCTNSSSSDDDSGGGSTGGSNPEQTGNGSFRTSCGTVVGDRTQNPANGEDGVAVTIRRAAGPDTVVVSRGGGEQLIKLRALSGNVPNFKASSAMTIIESFRGSAILFTNECPVVVNGGGRGIVGELFSTGGVSVTEAVITGGAAEIDASGGCNESLVAGCYQSLSDSSAPETGGSISNFLWKPRSERDGNLVILFNPGGATVVVNGTTLSNSGASNGRGTTARANRSGGSFGSNITVQAFDRRGRVLLFPGGATSYNIPNGSSRVEF